MESAKRSEALREEMQLHLAEKAAELEADGMTVEHARAEARRRFGNVGLKQEESREIWMSRFVSELGQDVRYGLRMLVNKPTLTIVAVLTLALGVGANTAIFSIVDAVLLRPLPYRDPDRLVRIFFNEPGVGLRDVRFSKPELDDLQTRAGVFEGVTPIYEGSEIVTGAGQPERLDGVNGSFGYFSILGVTPQIGRLFGPEDFVPGFAEKAVISDGLWRRAYGADPNVVGRTLRLDNDRETIIGVLPPGFRHPGPTVSGDAEVFCAFGMTGPPFPKPARGTRNLVNGLGRLKPGLTLAQAQARLTAMAAQLRQDFPGDYPPQTRWTIEIQPLQETLVGNVRPMLLVLLGAVILIVFIVSLNIANLLLARASGRQQEMAVRVSLGASRGRMVRQMLAESMLLSVIGGAAGVATAVGTLRFVLRFVPSSVPRLNEVRIDWVVLAFALLISILTGLMFGLAPAFHSAKVALSSAIREGGRGSGYSTKTGRLRDVLIVSELAFAVVLMVGAGLLLRTLRDLLQENPGFNPTQVVTANIQLPNPNDRATDPYRDVPHRATFDRELLRRMKAIPGVELAAITSVLPSTNSNPNAVGGITNEGFAIEDRPVESLQDLGAERIPISPDYFRVLQASLLRGRSFTESDEDGKPLVAIIDESTARKYWPTGDPLGRRVRFRRDATKPWTTIVGIIRDIKSDGLDIDGAPHIYVSTYQDSNKRLSVVLRTSLSASVLEPQIRHEIQSIDPGLPVFGIASMNEVLDRSLASRRFSANLVGGFAGVALVLASIGIYGLLVFMVGQRSREIGLRMALGARPADILKLVVTKGVVLAAVGIITGIILSACTASIMTSLLYGVRPHDPAVFVVVPLLLFAVAVLASYLPAWRATKVDTMTALREV
ncbi:MAG TPA: ABC transporter permease [Candidatus Limnocylindrales bacterium]|nr:ABC transporter permease [Candidatus Limnocylindrales bacterium]